MRLAVVNLEQRVWGEVPGVEFGEVGGGKAEERR